MKIRRGAIVTLALDRAAVEAVEALRRADVPSILLKGRSFATWLYGPGEFRPYTDVDLLVPDAQWDAAREVLIRLDYAPRFAARHDPAHASAHRRERDGVHLDLHRTLQGLTAPPQTVWDLLSEHTAVLPLGGSDVAVLDEVGRCVGVAVHAGRLDSSGLRARHDLDRAVAIADDAVWARARALADEVGGTAAFAAGLASTAAGRSCAAAIDIGVSSSRVGTGQLGVNSLDRALAADSLTQSGMQLARWIVPTPALLRRTRPIARRGVAGLAVAYVTWPAWLAVQFVRAARSRREAR